MYDTLIMCENYYHCYDINDRLTLKTDDYLMIVRKSDKDETINFLIFLFFEESKFYTYEYTNIKYINNIIYNT